jgi:transmembrane sensor
MTESEFEDMLQRYLAGASRPGEREVVEQWSQQLGEAENVTLPSAERAQLRATMWRHIRNRTLGDGDDGRAVTSRVLAHPAALWHTAVVRWAAVLLLLVGAAVVLVLPKKRQPATAAHKAATNWVLQRNTSKQTQFITLADSSRITLYPGSSLQYQPTPAGPRREVRLKGEAFFRVAKNPTRPFLVYTDHLVTTVLGTSFRVTAYVGHPNEVAVQEGRVSVQIRRGANLSASPAQPAAGGVLLLPNQQVAYSALAPRTLRKMLVANPVLLVPQVVTFEKQPVSKVLQSLEKAYGVDILYDPNKLVNCTVTVTFYQESLYEKLDVLSKALGASYATTDDARLQFRSNGCAL